MEHRHLLPEEIDQLVDGESGFGIPPLRAHVRQCDACRSDLRDAQALADALEELPHFVPQVDFADRVMAQVQVFEPWHVAAADSVRRWAPRSQPARRVLVAAVASFAAAGSLLTAWLFVHLDVVLFFGRMVVGDAREQIGSALGSTVASAVGEPALGALRVGGPLGVAIGLTALLLVAIGSVLTLRLLAATSRRIRG